MRLDRYIGEPPKFRVLRRVDDSDHTPANAVDGAVIQTAGGSYVEVEPFDYFVLALKDMFTPFALSCYATAAQHNEQPELAEDVRRLAEEASNRDDRKIPD